MKTSLSTATVAIGQFAIAALLIQGCTTYNPGRTALGGDATPLPGGTVVRLGDKTAPATTTIAPRAVTPAPRPGLVEGEPPPFKVFVVPEGTVLHDPHEGLTRTAVRHVPAPPPVDRSVATGATETETVTADGKYAVYVVKRGDTAGEIANRHGMTRAEFIRVNNLANPDRILVGQKLKVATGGQPLAAGRATEARSASDGEHVVASGETLGEIAQKYGMRATDLAALNGITNPNMIRVGQTLKVSKTAKPATTTPKPAVTAPRPATTPVTPATQPEVKSEVPVEDADPIDLFGLSIDPVPATDTRASERPVTAQPTPATPGMKEHVVKEGEDLFSIAIHYGVRPLDLRRVNGNELPSPLKAGTVIKIPAAQ